MMNLPNLLFLLLQGSGGQCLTVDTEWITAGDLGRKLPQYAEVDPDLRLIRAPFPGTRRIIPASGLARHFGDKARLTDSLCVERRLLNLTGKHFADAVSAALTLNGDAQVKFEVQDHDRSMLPSGKLEFLVQNLPPPMLGRPSDPVLWRGKLLYAEARSLPVWVRVRLWIEGEACVLARDLGRGEEVRTDDCKITKTKYLPFTSPPLQEPDLLEKTIAVRSLKAGEILYQTSIAKKPDVEAGKTVQLRVLSGGAQVRFQGTAVSSGHRGDPVVVTNPSTGKRIEGQIVGHGMVEVRLK